MGFSSMFTYPVYFFPYEHITQKLESSDGKTSLSTPISAPD